MTRDGTVGRSDATEPSLAPRRDIDPVRMMRPRFADPIRTASTGRTHDCKRSLRYAPNYLLPGGGHPHMLRSKATNANPWVIGLRRRRPSLVVAVALVNKTARIAWAVMHRKENYQRMAIAA